MSCFFENLVFEPAPLKSGDVHPAHVLRDVYGKNASNRPTIVVDPAEVPSHLRMAIPLVERWGIPCDVTRNDYIDCQPESVVAAFYTDAAKFVPAIRDWLSSLPADFTTRPAAATQFVYLLKAFEEAHRPSAETLAERRRRQEITLHADRQKDAVTEADAAFAARNYERVVEILSPFAETLDAGRTRKLLFAKKRSAAATA